MSSAIEDSAANQDSASEPTKECDHCGLIVPQGLIREDKPLQFCCSGCEIAYETIQACGLSDYYGIRKRLAEKGQPALGGKGKYGFYDSLEFQETNTNSIGEGRRSIELCLEGVHCAACLWLIEALPNILPGLISARLTLRSSTVRIAWIEDQILLSKIAETLNQLGYPPYLASGNQAREMRQQTDRKHLVDLAIAGALAGNCMLVAVALYAGMFQGIEAHFERLFRWLSMGLGLPALFWPGRRFFRGAWAAVRTRTANLDLPISLALGVGALAGTVNVLLDRGDIYFDSLSVLVFLLLVGRYIQLRQQRWAEDAVSLRLSLTSKSCRIIQGEQITEQPIEVLQRDDLVEVRSGDLFPADGIVVAGASSVDLSLLTGEALPVEISDGDDVFAGTQNIGRTIRQQVTEIGEATRIGKLLQLVEEGAKSKPPIVAYADRIAGWFLVVISAIAIVNFLAWSSIEGFEQAIDHTVALLIVACPCALGLATPLTIAMAIGKASQHKILIKDSAAVEQLGMLSKSINKVIYFDKTGTLTRGEIEVVSWHGDESIKSYVAALESESNHPIANAFVALAGEAAQEVSITERDDQLNGGLSGMTERGRLTVGSPRYLASSGLEIDQSIQSLINQGESLGNTVIVIGLDAKAIACAWLQDTLQSDANASLAQLRKSDWKCNLLSGDAEGPVSAIGKQLGFAESNTFASKTPEEKLTFIQTATAEDAKKRKLVVMVGDGVNDSAALAAADVGIAVHGGAEASLAASDIYISQPGTSTLAALFRFCRTTMKTIRVNLFISLSYNIIAVGLAAAGYITPLIAAILMPISSAIVLIVAIGTLSSSTSFSEQS